MVGFSSHPDLKSTFEYLRDELIPREKEDGAAWRIRKREDGREDKSRDRQYRIYRYFAIALGMEMAKESSTMEEAMAALQTRLDHSASHTAFVNQITKEVRAQPNADRYAKQLLGV